MTYMLVIKYKGDLYRVVVEIDAGSEEEARKQAQALWTKHEMPAGLSSWYYGARSRTHIESMHLVEGTGLNLPVSEWFTQAEEDAVAAGPKGPSSLP